MEQPRDELTTPSNASPIPDLADFIVNQGAAMLVSPTAWALKILEWFNHGENPLDVVLKEVTGDWNQVAQASDALDHVAAFYESLVNELQNQGSGLRAYWQGNAADAVTDYLNDLARAVEEMPSALRSASNDLNALAVGMFENARAISGALQVVGDLVITMAATAAATAATAETGIGAAVGGVGLLIEAVALANSIKAVTNTLNVMRISVGGIAGLTATYLSTVHTVSRFEEAGGGSLPSYDFRWA